MAPPVDSFPPTRNPLKRLYRWILSWAYHPAGTWALAVFSFVDSSFFPIPPLFLQVALSIEKPRRSWWYALVDSVASILGAVLGYYVGYALYESVGKWIIEINGYQSEFLGIGERFQRHAFLFILFWSFIPFPFKVITIGSGVYSEFVSLPTLLLASGIGRSFRFFGLGALCYFLGDKARTFVDRYFNWICLGIGLFVATVLLLMKVILKGR